MHEEGRHSKPHHDGGEETPFDLTTEDPTTEFSVAATTATSFESTPSSDLLSFNVVHMMKGSVNVEIEPTKTPADLHEVGQKAFFFLIISESWLTVI